eukprot:scaffold41987_cov423-Skeletonema_marinoi.AAC.1
MASLSTPALPTVVEGKVIIPHDALPLKHEDYIDKNGNLNNELILTSQSWLPGIDCTQTISNNCVMLIPADLNNTDDCHRRMNLMIGLRSFIQSKGESFLIEDILFDLYKHGISSGSTMTKMLSPKQQLKQVIKDLKADFEQDRYAATRKNGCPKLI